MPKSHYIESIAPRKRGIQKERERETESKTKRERGRKKGNKEGQRLRRRDPFSKDWKAFFENWSHLAGMTNRPIRPLGPF